MHDADRSPRAGVLRIVLIYAVFAFLWILLSDMALKAAFTDPLDITFAGMLKGWLFVGIALFPENDHNDAPLDILRRTSTALHYSKKRGGGETTFFESALDETAKQCFEIERELHHAIATGAPTG